MKEMRDQLASNNDFASRLEVWTLNGAIEHGLSLSSLRQIAQKYAKI